MEPTAHLDSLSFTRYEASKSTQKYRYIAGNSKDARIWQGKLRRALSRLIGAFPQAPVALNPRLVDREEFPRYTRETVLFDSRSASTVFAHLLIPNEISDPRPALVCCPGHGRGCDDIVGIEEDGSMRSEWGGYQRDFALQAVDHGFVAMAIEQLGFGHRRDATARSGSSGASSCQPSAGAALLLGQTMVGWRVYDIMRSIDYLQSRAEVDSGRIGCMGISGGGTTTFFAAALDRRIKAALVSGYFNSFRDSIFSIPHCIDNYVPGILEVAEMSDIAGLIAPRPLFVESGTRDDIFPVTATVAAFDQARKIFECFGASDRLGLEIFEGEHQFHGVKGFPFLKKWL